MDNLNPGNNKNDYTIRIVDLIWYILSKWRSIVISMLIFALTVAALGYCMNAKIKTPMSTREYYIQRLNESSEHSQEEIEKLDVLARIIAGHNEQVEGQNQYFQSSILAHIDWMNVVTATSSYRVDLNAKADIAELYILADAFCSRLNSEEFLAETAEKLGTESKYLDELFSARYVIPQPSSSVDNSNGFKTVIIYLSVKGMDREFCDKVLAEGDRMVDQISGELSSSVTENTASYIQTVFKTVRDKSIRDAQQEEEKSYNAQITQVNNLLSGLTKAEKQYVEAIAELSEEQSEEPVQFINRLAIIKYFVVGLILGGFAGAAFHAAMYVLGNAVRNPFALEDMHGVRTYLREADVGKRRWPDGIIYKARYNQDKVFESGNLFEILGAELSAQAKKEGLKKILVTGTELAEEDEELIDGLRAFMAGNGVEVISGKDIMYSQELIEASEDADAAVVMERAGHSNYHKVQKEMEFMKFHKLPVLAGIMTVE